MRLLLLFSLAFALIAAPASAKTTKPTIVLVHGAFADASGWNAVTEQLQDDGYKVLAPPNPLRGVSADAAYMRSFLAQVKGPIILVGHSYGGMVITNAATGNANVKALVYIAAFAPAQGDTVLSLSGMALGEPSGPPAWASIPSYYMVASKDNTIGAANERIMAKRIKAKTVEIKGASHVVFISHPKE